MKKGHLKKVLKRAKQRKDYEKKLRIKKSNWKKAERYNHVLSAGDGILPANKKVTPPKERIIKNKKTGKEKIYVGNDFLKEEWEFVRFVTKEDKKDNKLKK